MRLSVCLHFHAVFQRHSRSKSCPQSRHSVYWYYFTSVLYHLSMGLMEGIGMEKTIKRVKDNFWKTATSAWIYWCATLPSTPSVSAAAFLWVHFF